MSQQPQKLGDLIPGLMSRWRLDLAQRINALWPQIAGPAVAQVTRPLGIRHSGPGRAGEKYRYVLLIEVQSSSWAQELALLRGQFLAKYGQLLPGIALVDIRFQARSWYENRTEPADNAGAIPAIKTAAMSLLPLTPQEVAAIELQLQAVGLEIRPAMRTMLDHEARLAKTRLASGWMPCGRCSALHPGALKLCRLCELLG